MISQIKILNYESHKDTVIDLHPGLNVIVGESDKGKSGFFRAFNKCRTNRPLGSGMKPLYWDGDGLVQITFDEGQVVSWIQNKSGNFYQVNNSTPINAGTDVPDEIGAIFNMEEINCQTQIDRAFLMFETPGERGRILNRLASLDKIDSTIANAKSDIRKIQSSKKIQEQLIAEYQEDLTKYKELPTAGDLLQEAGKLNIQIQVNKQTITSLKLSWSRKQELLKSAEKLKDLPTLEQLVSKSQKLFNEIDQNEILYKKIELAFANKRRLESTQIDTRKLAVISKLISESEQKFIEYKTKNQQYNSLSRLVKNQEEYVQQIIGLAKKIDDLKKKIPNLCPTCGSILEVEK